MNTGPSMRRTVPSGDIVYHNSDAHTSRKASNSEASGSAPALSRACQSSLKAMNSRTRLSAAPVAGGDGRKTPNPVLSETNGSRISPTITSPKRSWRLIAGKVLHASLRLLLDQELRGVDQAPQNILQ